MSVSLQETETNRGRLSYDLHRDELSPSVRDYADDLADTIRQTAAEVGASSLDDFAKQLREGTIDKAVAQHLYNQVARLYHVVEHGCIRNDWSQGQLLKSFDLPLAVTHLVGTVPSGEIIVNLNAVAITGTYSAYLVDPDSGAGRPIASDTSSDIMALGITPEGGVVLMRDAGLRSIQAITVWNPARSEIELPCWKLKRHSTFLSIPGTHKLLRTGYRAKYIELLDVRTLDRSEVRVPKSYESYLGFTQNANLICATKDRLDIVELSTGNVRNFYKRASAPDAATALADGTVVIAEGETVYLWDPQETRMHVCNDVIYRTPPLLAAVNPRNADQVAIVDSPMLDSHRLCIVSRATGTLLTSYDFEDKPTRLAVARNGNVLLNQGQQLFVIGEAAYE